MAWPFLQYIDPLKRAFTDLLFPPVCLSCERVPETFSPVVQICLDCWKTITALPENYAQTYLRGNLESCYIDELFIPFKFDDVLQKIIHGFKYRKMPELGLTMGQEIAKHFAIVLAELEDVLVIPVPIHPVRRKEREYNQSTFIANGIGRISGHKYQENILIRKKYTVSQTKLNHAQRQFNVKDAFSVASPALVKNKVIILVDDVFTTGATMNECAWVLKSADAGHIIGMTLAATINKS